MLAGYSTMRKIDRVDLIKWGGKWGHMYDYGPLTIAYALTGTRAFWCHAVVDVPWQSYVVFPAACYVRP